MKNKIDKFLEEKIFLDDFSPYRVSVVNGLNEIKKNEEIVNKLFEKKGVAMYDFKSEIRGITDYILKKFYEEYKKISWYYGQVTVENSGVYSCFINEKNIQFQIPREITKTITFIKKLQINVDILNLKNINISSDDEALMSINSFAVSKPNNLTLFKKRIKDGIVNIGLVSINGILTPDNVSRKLYHELGHLFQDFNLQKNKNSLYKQLSTDSYYANKRYFTTSKNEYIRKIGRVFYVLFNKMELSQHSTEIYTELTEKNANKLNINREILNTRTYKWYKSLCDYVTELNDYNGTDIWEATKKFYGTKSHKNGFPNLTANEFKTKFIKLAIKQLNVFYRKMMNAVELFLEEKN